MIFNPVYEEWAFEMIPAPGHGPDVHYRVFFGTVNWDRQPGTMKKAAVVFMQYGQTREWQLALASGEIALGMPAHVLREDVPTVTLALLTMHERETP